MNLETLTKQFEQREHEVVHVLRHEPPQFERLADALSGLFAATNDVYLAATDRYGGEDRELLDAIRSVGRVKSLLADLHAQPAIRRADQRGRVAAALQDTVAFLDNREREMSGMLQARADWSQQITRSVANVLGQTRERSAL